MKKFYVVSTLLTICAILLAGCNDKPIPDGYTKTTIDFSGEKYIIFYRGGYNFSSLNFNGEKRDFVKYWLKDETMVNVDSVVYLSLVNNEISSSGFLYFHDVNERGLLRKIFREDFKDGERILLSIISQIKSKKS